MFCRQLWVQRQEIYSKLQARMVSSRFYSICSKLRVVSCVLSRDNFFWVCPNMVPCAVTESEPCFMLLRLGLPMKVNSCKSRWSKHVGSMAWSLAAQYMSSPFEYGYPWLIS